jgi:glucokinase
MGEAWVAGIEIGGTKLQLGVGQGRGDLIALARIGVDPGRHAGGILLQIESAFPTLLEQAQLDRRQIRAVGVGFGGPVDTGRGRVQKSFQIGGWEDFALGDHLRERLDVPRVVVHNDSDSAGLAEARFGAGVGFSPLLYMNVGSGIGGALVVDDRIYSGSGKGTMEIGHLHVIDPAASEVCQRELEQVASGWALGRAAQEHARRMLAQSRTDWVVLDQASGDPSQITAVTVAAAARAGDAVATSILSRAHSAIAFALVQAITLLAPRRIVLGGGVSLIGEEGWIAPIRRLVERDVFPPFRSSFEIVPATLGEEVVVQGALALARDSLESTGC